MAIILAISIVLSVACAYADTNVGGIISSNTTWTLANSPYKTTGTNVQIAEGVTLTIEPGVVINDGGGYIFVWGILNAIGTNNAHIIFNAVKISPGSNATSASVNIQFAEFNGGTPYRPTSANIGTLILRDSVIQDSSEGIYLYYPKSDCYLERNIFINSSRITINSDGGNIYIRNNVFYKSLGSAVWGQACYGPPPIVEYNSFLGPLGTWGIGVSDTGCLTAINNFWDTTNTNTIDTIIHDRNDDLACANYIDYLPILNAPDPNTPTFTIPCTYTITPTSQSFTSTGGTGSVTVTASASSCGWTATESLSWATINSGSSGTGSGTVSYSISANTGTSSRTGTITIAGQTFTITQAAAAANCTYTISPTNQSFTSAAGTGSISITASSGSCGWTATSSLSWATINSGSSGTGNGTVSYSVSANTTGASRSGNMTIAGQTFTITQSAPPCTYAISPTSQSFTSAGGTGSINITASSGSCGWTATESLSWVTITSGSSGTGNGTVSYSISANTGTSSRTGTITIAGQTFTITQSGIQSNNCAAVLSGNFLLHGPIIIYNGQAYWADFQYTQGMDFSLTDAGMVTDMSPYNGCATSTLSNDFKLHMPEVIYNGISYWADFQYTGGMTFTLTGAGIN